MSRITNVHKYFGNHKISLYRHEICYYLFKCFIILLVFLSTFFLSAADSFKINLKYFYISINCLRTVTWIMHSLLFKLKNIYLNNAFFFKLFMESGSCPKHCQNKFLTMWYVSKIVVSPFSWQHHTNASSLTDPYSFLWLLALLREALCWIHSPAHFHKNRISQHYLWPMYVFDACLIYWNKQITMVRNTIHLELVITKC